MLHDLYIPSVYTNQMNHCFCLNTYEIAVYESVFVWGGGGQNSIFQNGGGGQKEKMKINRGVTYQKIQTSEKFLQPPQLINNDRSLSLVFSHLGFWSGSLFLIAPFPDLCLLVLC